MVEAGCDGQGRGLLSEQRPVEVASVRRLLEGQVASVSPEGVEGSSNDHVFESSLLLARVLGPVGCRGEKKGG